MKKYLLFLVLTTTCSRICAQHNLSLNIEGLSYDTLYMVISSLNNPNKEDMKILTYQEGECYYDLPDSNTYLATVQPRCLTKYKKNGRPVFGNSCSITHILIKPDTEIKIKANIVGNNYLNYEVTGSGALNELSKHRRSYKDLDIRMDSINLNIELANTVEERNLLFKKRTEVAQRRSDLQSEYIRNHIHSHNKSCTDLISRYLFLNHSLYEQFSTEFSGVEKEKSEYAPVLKIIDDNLKVQKRIHE